MKELLKSLSDFQEECPVIHKGTQGYGYTYADLPAIFKVINPLLKKHGLGFTQPLDGTSVKTIIYHIKTGEMLESSVEIPQDVQLKGQNPFQVIGSAITYYRRYALASVLGIITDKDVDATGQEVPKTLTKKKTTAQTKKKATAQIKKDMAKAIANAREDEQQKEAVLNRMMAYELSEQDVIDIMKGE